MKTDDKFAVVMGRFQPFHAGHGDIFVQLQKNFDNVIVLVGEEQEGDPLTFEQRANFFRKYLKIRFKKFVIMPMYDHDDWDKWAVELKQSVSVITDNAVLIKSKKEKDVNDKGWHYLDYLDKWFPESLDVKVVDHDLHATDIRKNPDNFIHLVADELKPFIKHNVGKKYKNVQITDLHSESKWVSLKQVGNFVYSERRNRDSIAFVIRNTNTNCIGLLIEQKPPLGIVDVISAFGGSFDVLNDNPYRIVKQEAVEEAGITEFWPIYKGSYMATTQSSEIIHLFVLETTQTDFNPQTMDIGELGNKCIWLTEEEAKNIPDWRVQLCLLD